MDLLDAVCTMDQNATDPDAAPRKPPPRLAHVVYRTRRFDAMLRWYRTVFGAHVVLENPAMAFLTFDDEHHRFAFVNLDAVRPDAPRSEHRTLTGIDHVAYTYATLHDLFDLYETLKAQGIEPYWAIHHGPTVSLYYADPDGNQMEFQVDRFDVPEQAMAYIRGPAMEQNPVGVEIDPSAWSQTLRAGTPAKALFDRQVHLPVSPIRGSLMSAGSR